MKILSLVLLIYTSIYAYNINDTLDENTLNKLHIDNSKVSVVSFFASWCSSCQKELPLINELYRHIDKSRVEIIGIDVDKDIDKAITFQKKLDLKFIVINDPENSLIHNFNPKGIPALYYIKNKKIVGIHFGAIDNINEVILKDLNRL